MAETYISLIKATNWVDLSPEHTQLRQTLESDIANTCCGNEYRQPIMLQGAFGIGKTTTLNYLFHYAWEVLKVPTFHILLSDLVEIIKTTAKDQGVEQIQNEDLGRIIKSTIDDQIEKLKNSDWTSLTNVMFPDFISLDEEHPLTLNEYLKGFNPVEIDACIDDQTKQILSNGFTQDVIKEAINSQMNCTPKVRQKTFGVQFVYEKDIHREAQYSKLSTLWGTPETIVCTVPSWAALLRKSDRPLSQIR